MECCSSSGIMDFNQTTGEKFRWLLYQAFKSRPKYSWRDKVTNEGLYGDLLKVARKVRLSAAGHFHHHQEEAAGTLILWDPRHGSAGSRHKTYVQVLLEDTGLENIDQNWFLWWRITIYGNLLLITDMMMMVTHSWNDDEMMMNH